mgnify:FL=1
MSNSLQFKGTLSAINTYLKEQQNRYFIYDPNLYKLNEKDFVNRMFYGLSGDDGMTGI